MADEKLARAQKVFNTMCETFSSNEWFYTKDEGSLSIEFKVKGDDLPMEFNVKIDAKRQLIMLLSQLPFTVPEDKRLDVAIAVSVVNNKLADGSFDYDIATGTLLFRMTSSFMESDIGNDLFMYLMICSSNTIDDY
ncbi:MAG: hypothetical protein ACI396_05610, partial [Acutalibacteraceae bacterium]